MQGVGDGEVVEECGGMNEVVTRCETYGLDDGTLDGVVLAGGLAKRRDKKDQYHIFTRSRKED